MDAELRALQRDPDPESQAAAERATLRASAPAPWCWVGEEVEVRWLEGESVEFANGYLQSFEQGWASLIVTGSHSHAIGVRLCVQPLMVRILQTGKGVYCEACDGEGTVLEGTARWRCAACWGHGVTVP